MVKKTVNDFCIGDRVLIVSGKGELEHGMVSSTNSEFVFIKFDTPTNCITTPLADITAQACQPEYVTVTRRANLIQRY